MLGCLFQHKHEPTLGLTRSGQHVEGCVGGQASFSESGRSSYSVAPPSARCARWPPAPGTVSSAPPLFFVCVGRILPWWGWEWEHSQADFCKWTFEPFSSSPQVTAASFVHPEGVKWHLPHHHCSSTKSVGCPCSLWDLPAPPTMCRTHSHFCVFGALPSAPHVFTPLISTTNLRTSPLHRRESQGTERSRSHSRWQSWGSDPTVLPALSARPSLSAAEPESHPLALRPL